MRTLTLIEGARVAGGRLGEGTMQAVRITLDHESLAAKAKADPALAPADAPAEELDLPNWPKPPAGPCGPDRVCQFFQ